MQRTHALLRIGTFVVLSLLFVGVVHRDAVTAPIMRYYSTIARPGAPSSGNGFQAGKGAIYVDTTTSNAYVKSGTGATSWSSVGGGAGVASDYIFGAGYDGSLSFNGSAVTCAGGRACTTLVGNTYTLTSAISAVNVDCGGAYTIKTAGSPLFINGALSGSCTFDASGSAGTSITTTGTAGNGGAGGAGNWFAAGGAGGGGAINSSSSAGTGTSSSNAPGWCAVSTTNLSVTGGAAADGGDGLPGTFCRGGAGGGKAAFATGQASGGNSGTITSVGDDLVFPHLMLTGRGVTGALFGPSTGGGGGASPDAYGACVAVSGVDGAGGGGAGGYMLIAAKSTTFTGTLRAKGGAGGNGYSWDAVAAGCSSGGGGGGAGGGGAGGTVVFIYGSGTAPTIDVAGGAGGVGGTQSTGTDHFNGGDGGSGSSGRAFTIKLGNN